MTVGLSSSYPILSCSQVYQWVPSNRKVTAILQQYSAISKYIGWFQHACLKGYVHATSMQLLPISISLNLPVPCMNSVWPMDQWLGWNGTFFSKWTPRVDAVHMGKASLVPQQIILWLVAYLPLWKRLEWKSIGMMKFPVFENIKVIFHSSSGYIFPSNQDLFLKHPFLMFQSPPTIHLLVIYS